MPVTIQHLHNEALVNFKTYAIPLRPLSLTLGTPATDTLQVYNPTYNTRGQ